MKNKKIIVGISGGIAVYKVCSLIGQLKREGAEIKVIMTEAAAQFVAPLTFQTLSSHPVYIDMFKVINQEEVEHISLAQWGDLMVFVPATANIISKIANGIADDLLTTVAMALPPKTPVLIAPAMNTNMWVNEITQLNVQKLRKIQKYHFVGPGVGKLACGDEGEGTLIDNDEILNKIKSLL